MAIKDLAVAYDASATADAALALAVQMARKYGATLTGLYAAEPVAVDKRVERWMSTDMVSTLKAPAREAATKVRAAFDARTAALGLTGPSEFEVLEGAANRQLATASRFHDILLVGQYSDAKTERGELRAEDLVLRLGRPLLVVPHDYEVRPFQEYAVIAWDGSRPATRALSDAMQILETKRRLDILTIRVRGEPYDAAELDALVAHLRRHGVDAQPISVPAHRAGIGTTILEYARDAKPDILVMGAYGHSKLREDLFGGTTRRVLHQMSVPVLMAH